jgi:hypothetical protein
VAKLYKNCKVKIKAEKNFTEVDYTTGAHQVDNISLILFLFIIQAFFETLQLEAQPIKFSHGNAQTAIL